MAVQGYSIVVMYSCRRSFQPPIFSAYRNILFLTGVINRQLNASGFVSCPHLLIVEFFSCFFCVFRVFFLGVLDRVVVWVYEGFLNLRNFEKNN